MNPKPSLSLLVDFYELTMMHGYYHACPEKEAVFEMFFRSLPYDGGYAVFAGLAPLAGMLQSIRFDAEELAYLESQKLFSPEFLEYLSGFSFRGDIWSVPEGTVVFANEPLIRVRGTLMEAQFVESMLLNMVNFQSLIATKTARIVHAAGTTPVLEFGLRRAQGIDGALSATRAAYIGGAAATSNTAAGRELGIPVSGTMAHSWVMSFDSELEAFERYAALYPDKSVLLVDTFNTLQSGIPNAIKVFRTLQPNKPSLMAVRIDSGDLEYLSQKSRLMFDAAGLPDVKIFVSSDLDEHIIEHLRHRGAPVDSWGVGTKLVTGADDAALTGVYKIVSKKEGGDFEPCIKISNQPEKITNPGVKNILRFHNGDGQMLADLLYLEGGKRALLDKTARHSPVRFNHPASEYASFVMKNYSSAEVLLVPVLKDGQPVGPLPTIEEARARRADQMGRLDETYKRLLNPHTYKVSLSNRLKELKTRMIRDHEA